MLRVNLASRPFYNERAVYVLLGLVAGVGVVVFAASLVLMANLSRRNGELEVRADAAIRAGADLNGQIAGMRQHVEPDGLDDLTTATQEANTLIDQRVFSWTDFFNRIEATLPSDVMLTEVRPDIVPGSIEVTMGVLGRRLEGISEFVVSLEASGAFDGVLNRQVELTADGMYSALLRGRYNPTAVVGAEGDDSSGRVDDSGPLPRSDEREVGSVVR